MSSIGKTVNRNVQGVSQSQAIANSRYHKEEKKDKIQRVQNKQINAREAHRPALSSPGDVITMLKNWKKNENKDQRKTQHETPHSKNHKPNKVRTTPGPPP